MLQYMDGMGGMSHQGQFRTDKSAKISSTTNNYLYRMKNVKLITEKR